jgi:hypothetical protein
VIGLAHDARTASAAVRFDAVRFKVFRETNKETTLNET